MGIHYKAVFRSGDRLSGSAYGEPVFSNLNFPNLSMLQDYQFAKVFVSDALINADISGTDQSHVCIQMVGKQPLNSVRVSGNGSSNSAPFLAMVPFVLKEAGQTGLYYTVTTDERSYFVLPMPELQDTNISFRLTDGSDQLIEEPAQTDFIGYSFCLTIEPIKSIRGCNCDKGV